MAEQQDKLDANLEKMRRLMLDLTAGEALEPAAFNGVKLVRVNRDVPRCPVHYQPSICVLVSGRRLGFMGETEFILKPNQYLILSGAAPFEVAIEAESTSSPMLGISIQVDMSILTELARKLDLREGSFGDDSPIPAAPTPLDVEMSEAVLRLLCTLQSHTDALILGPTIVRELIYRALVGPQGGMLRSMLNRTQHWGKICTALEWIHHNYSRPITIPDMADEACMSVSTFHHSFKGVTGKSPLQYVKSIRLHKARLFIRYDRLTASVAAAKVGYESPSQFSRDFKRFFGHNPTEESAMRGASRQGK